MKHKAHVALAALALGTSGTAWAVPDSCDDGATYLTGVLPVANATAYSASFQAIADSDFLGRALATGDWNGDGITDVAMGAIGVDTNGAGTGAVYIYWGGGPAMTQGIAGGTTQPIAAADVVVTGESYGDRTGYSLSSGDVDGDGLDDLIIGSLASAGSSGGAGLAHVVFGTTLSTDSDIDLATEADVSIIGEHVGDSFGSVVSFVGDLNQDGYGDVAIGAPTYSRLVAGRGAVYVFYGEDLRGGGDFVATALTAGRIEGAVGDANFGTSISAAGFFDGDAFPDFAVGAPADNTASSRAGAAFVFAGGAVPLAGNISATTALQSIYGRYAFRCGAALALAGDADLTAIGTSDVDADGYSDLWVGCKQAGSMKEGMVALVPGGITTGSYNVYDVAQAMVWGNGTNYLAGSSLATGDVDHDGVMDLIVGGERGAGDVFGSGAVGITYGPFPHGAVRTAGGYGPNNPQGGARLQGQAYEDFMGAAVAVGDVNNDGYADVFAAGWRSSQWGYRRGVVALFLAGADTADQVTFYKDEDNDGYGNSSATTLGCSNAPPTTGGFSWILTQGDCLDTDALFYPGAHEGCSDPDYNCDGTVGAADQDGDGVIGCSIGANVGDCNDANAAISPLKTEKCNAVDDDCDGLVDAEDPSVSDATIWYLDADGDTYGLTASRTPSCTATAPFANAVQVFGDCDDTPITGVNINPAQHEICGDGINNDCANGTDDQYAIDALTFWRDSDQDTYGDPKSAQKACSRPVGYAENRLDCNDTQSAVNPAAVETCDYTDNNCDGMNYHGGREPVADRAFATFLGADAGDQIRSGGFLGDQDGDGMDELVLIADHSSDRVKNGGHVMLKFGDVAGGAVDLSNPDGLGSGQWDVEFYATRNDSGFGSAIGHGDYNGDGTQDIAIGAPVARTPNAYQGAVYIYYGPISPGAYTAEEADVIIRGAAADHNFGSRIQSNDFDNDGYDDLIVSARTFTSTFAKQGRVYVIYGSAGLLGNLKVDTQVPNVKTFTGYAANDMVGSSLSTGDFDGDGNVDFVIGAQSVGGQFSPGAAYLFYGNSARPAGATLTPSVTLTGENADSLGLSVAFVGDTDQDGKDDLVLGANNSYTYFLRGRTTRLTGAKAIRDIYSVRFDTTPGINRLAAPVGDLNLDTFDDFVIIAQDFDDGIYTDVGAAYIVYGRSDWTLILPDHSRFNVERLESFGRVDPNGRTLPDGLPLVHSASSYNVPEGARIKGESASDGFGLTSGRGDYDGDGFPDFALSAPGSDRNGIEQQNGKIYLLLGGGYGVDVFVTDNSARDWYWDYDADTWTTDRTLHACGMHRPISFRDPTNPIPRAWLNMTPQLDCDDYNENIHPGATEQGGLDGVDQDCDGFDLPNVLPTITVTLVPGAPLVSDTLTAQVVIDDSAETIHTPITLQYEWYKDTGSGYVQIAGQSSSTLLPTNFAKGDRIQVRVRADDTRGLTPWKTASVTIQNSKPTLASCDVTPATAGVGTDLNVQATGLADDDAGDQNFLTTSYQWQLLQFPAWKDIPGQVASALPSCATRNVPATDPNSFYNCQRGSKLRAVCTPHDPAIAGDPVVSNVIEIQNTKPYMQVCAINPATAYTDTPLTAVAVAADPDFEAITISYEWYVNGSSTGSTGSSLDASVTSHFDQVQLKCTPRDFYGDYGATVTSAPIVIQNTAPTGVSIDLLPNFPRSNEDLYVNITQVSSDKDGDSITYFYYWQKNGSSFLNPTYPSQVSTVLKSSIRKGETWTVTVVPNDGYADGPSATDSVLIYNTAPSITSAVISPSNPTSDQALTGIGGGYFDWDGDPPSNKYQWWIEGTPVASAAGGTSQVLPAAPGRRGKKAFVVITADDGDINQDGNTLTSDFVTYANTPPYAPTLNPISPNQPGEDDDLLCSFSAASTDYDVDPVTYHVEWWQFRPNDRFNAPNGSGTYTRVLDFPTVSSTTGNEYTLPKALTQYADRYYCKVTPNDGFADGPSVQTAEKGINDNNAPAQPTVTNIDRYRNGTTFTIAGTCTSFPNDCLDLHVACTDSLSRSFDIAAPNPLSSSWCQSGAFSRTITGDRGVTYTCSAYCYDIGGNRSLNSQPSAVTEICSSTQFDAWELSGTAASHGDTQADAINGTLNGDGTTMTQWGILADTNTTSVTIVGNILGSGYDFTPVDVYDWYYVRSSDSYTTDVASGFNRYNFEINMDQGAADYEMQVIRRVAGVDTTMCPSQLGTNGAIGTFDDFNYYNYDKFDYPAGQAAFHTSPTDRQACDGNVTGAFNQCTDFTSDYYIRVSRQSAESCQNYRLQIRNGDPTWL